MALIEKIQLALRHYQAGNLDQAEYICKEILKIYPDNTEVLYFLGFIYFQIENYDLSIMYIEKALQINQTIPDAYHILGMAFQGKGQIESAIQSYKKTIQLNPNYVEAYNNLGNIFKEKGQFDQAMYYYQKAIQINPDMAITHRNLGVTYQEKGKLDEAIICYQKAVQIDPNYAATYYLLGYALMQQNKIQEAVDNYKLSLRLNPNSAATLSNLGSALGHQGKLDEGEECLRRAIQIEPKYLSACQTLIMMMNYNSRHDAQTICSEHLKFARHFAEPLFSTIIPHANIRNTKRRIKIGYVSSDFKQHSVSYFIEPVMAAHNRNQFQLFCYSNVTIHDEVTMRFQNYADKWRNILKMSDEQATQLIRNDAIDILIDLAGHSSNNRILLFARKPAPVQVTWIGYPATTGISTIDYKIVDEYTDPPGMTEMSYTEKLIRLQESFLCYIPDKKSPEINIPPFLTSGHITFGSFNNFAKVSPEILSLWIDILHALPDAHLMMKARSFSDKMTRDYVRDIFIKERINTERIELMSWEPSLSEHLRKYNEIDIGLDTFPYNGTTTTCEAMWMGVPVITFAGNTHASRVGKSLLSNVGLSELVAKTTDEFISIAIGLAEDSKRLQSLRENLREMMIHSSLCDAERFTKNLEMCYHQIWEKWCTTG
jgi:protein O-GlcNAc transferase